MTKLHVWKFNVPLISQESHKIKHVKHVLMTNQSTQSILRNVSLQIMLDSARLINHFMTLICINVLFVHKEQHLIKILIIVKVIILLILQICHQISVLSKHHTIIKIQRLVRNVQKKDRILILWLKLVKIVPNKIQLIMLKQRNVKFVHNKSLSLTLLKEVANNVQNYHHFTVTLRKIVKNVLKTNLISTHHHLFAHHVHQHQLFITQNQTHVTDAL